MSKRAEFDSIWTRAEPGARRPRYTRDQIAATALAIADLDGIDAVSMRRVAVELGAGTMTLYHYVRGKDELLDLMDDAIMGQVLVPPEALGSGWRTALTAIARNSCNAFLRHPWAVEGLRGAHGGPNSMRHFEQTLAAVASLDLPLADKLDLVSIVDDYVFGFVQRTGELNRESEGIEEHLGSVMPYFASLVETGEYPNIAELFAGHDMVSGFQMVLQAFRADGRFERGLERVLDGLELWLERREAG
jgi:AcrR family transcriptional regulator